MEKGKRFTQNEKKEEKGGAKEFLKKAGIALVAFVLAAFTVIVINI